MNQPSSRHLSHDFPAWQGLSLRELFWIVISCTPLVTIIFVLVGLVIDYPIASGCIGFLVGFILAITVFPKRIARIKSNKPYGYIRKQAIQLLVQLRLKHSPWIQYQGKWKRSKSIRKLAAWSVVQEDTERRTAVCNQAHEDSSTVSTKQCANAVEFLGVSHV